MKSRVFSLTAGVPDHLEVARFGRKSSHSRSQARSRQVARSVATAFRLVALAFLPFLFALDCAAQATNANAPDPASFQVFVAGFDAIQQTNAGTTFRDIIALPESKALRSNLWDRIVPVLAQRFAARNPQPGANPSELLRPLLDPLLDAPTYFEVRRAPNGATEWIAAVRLTPSIRANANAARLAEGWRFRTATGTNLLVQIATNSWVGLAGLSDSPNSPDWSARFPNARAIFERGRPVDLAPDQFARLVGNPDLVVPRLWPSGTNTPTLTLTVQGKGETLRTDGRIYFPRAVNWKLEAWRVPTNSIRDPNGSLMSFTVLRGFRDFATALPWVKSLALAEIPNQLFAWQDSHAAFQVFAALPVPNAATWLRQATNGPLAPLQQRLAASGPGELNFRAEDSRLLWSALPWIVPYLLPTEENSTNFIVGGVFPLNDPQGDRAPDPLVRQATSRPNLLYYDWEITELRLAQLRPLGQLLSLIFTWPQLEPDSPIFQWVEAVGPKLGNTVTEVSVISPRELSFVRNSHIGLSGVELLVLAHWIQMEQFPGAAPLSLRSRQAAPAPR